MPISRRSSRVRPPSALRSASKGRSPTQSPSCPTRCPPPARTRVSACRCRDCCRSRLLLLVITGEDKRAVLERAQSDGDWRQLPVAALLRSAHPQFEVHWSP
jgi:6-phosphogluconolactonase/glucosamine-6-phosphate isomerase/deaminase